MGKYYGKSFGGVDIMDYDDMLFKKKLRDVEKGTIIVMGREYYRDRDKFPIQRSD